MEARIATPQPEANYPSADNLLNKRLDAEDFIRLFQAAVTMHFKKNITNAQYFGIMRAVYASHTALTGILQRIPPHHTGNLALIQQELEDSLRPQ